MPTLWRQVNTRLKYRLGLGSVNRNRPRTDPEPNNRFGTKQPIWNRSRTDPEPNNRFGTDPEPTRNRTTDSEPIQNRPEPKQTIRNRSRTDPEPNNRFGINRPRMEPEPNRNRPNLTFSRPIIYFIRWRRQLNVFGSSISPKPGLRGQALVAAKTWPSSHQKWPIEIPNVWTKNSRNAQ